MIDVVAAVVTKDGQLRNSILLERLSSLGVKATLLSNEPNVESIDFSKTRLTRSEFHCKNNHHRALTQSLENHDWALIIEDDVDLDVVELGKLFNLLAEYDISKPTIFSLHANPFALVSASSKFHPQLWKCVFGPPDTRAYLATRSVLPKMDDNVDAIYPADWPNWSRHVNFYVGRNIAWEIPAPSLIAEHRDLRAQVRLSPLREFNNILSQSDLNTSLHFLARGYYFQVITKFRRLLGYKFLKELV